MTHVATTVAVVEGPAASFCQSIGAVDDAGDVEKDQVTIVFPLLDGKVLDVNVASTVGGLARVDHFNRCFVVAVHICRFHLFETQAVVDIA